MTIDPDSVTSIEDGTFQGCSSLTSVTIPESVTSIGGWAFYGCKSLTAVTVPASVTSIGMTAFGACERLTSIAVSPANAVYSSENGVLFNKDKTTLVGFPGGKIGHYTIPDSVTTIGVVAFMGGYGLTSVTIPDSVTVIEEEAFQHCKNLTSVTIPSSITYIDVRAFAYCDSLTSVTISNSVTSIREGAFKSSNLESVEIPYSVTSIGERAFAGNSLTEVDITNPNTVVGDDAFESSVIITGALFSAPYTYFIKNNIATITNCETSASGALEIPSAYNGYPVTAIGAYAFQDCDGLTSVTIPDSVTSIGRGAFSDCSAMASVTIPDSVASIAFDVFHSCENLTNIEVSTANAQYSSENGVLFNKDKTTLVAFPAGKSGHYTIPDTVTTIGQMAFRGSNSLTSVTIPDSVTSIARYAFFYCKNLTKITIPESVTSIEHGTFQHCESLTSITIPESVISIGEKAFKGTGLTTVSIPNEDTVIDASAFEASVTIFSGKAATIDSQETVTSTAVGETLVLAMVTSGTNVTYQWSKGGYGYHRSNECVAGVERCYGVGCRQLRTEGE